jgi:RNA polymerase sigma factor (sigma-70 family)
MTSETTGTDDVDLVARARDGDDGAYAELWRRHHDAGRRAARAVTRTFDADDVVQEAFTRVLSAVRRGGGPDSAFRPYLYAAIRNVVADWGRAGGDVRLVDPTDDAPDPDAAFDGALLERNVTGAAFRRLRPEWQAVLWYTEVERMKPREAAPLLGLSANATAALAYRARDALRTAWLQAHVNHDAAEGACRWAAERLGAYSRGRLARRDHDRVEEHLGTCHRCSGVLAELDDVAGSLRVVLLPLALGPAGASLAGAGPLAGGASGVAPGTGGALRRAQRWARRSPVTAASMAAAALVVAGAATASVLAVRDTAPHVQTAPDGHAPAASSTPVPERGPAGAALPADGPQDEGAQDEGAQDEGAQDEGPTGDRTAAPTGSATSADARVETVPALRGPRDGGSRPGAAEGEAPEIVPPVTPEPAGPGGQQPPTDGDQPGGDPGTGLPDEEIPDEAPDETPDEEVPDETPGEGVPDETPGEGVPDETPGEGVPDETPDAEVPGVAAPVVTALDTLGGLALPVVSGTGLPGAEVRVLDEAGAVVGRTTADEAGTWSVLAEIGAPSAVLTVVQGADGAVSAPAAVGRVVLDAPVVVALADGVSDPVVTFTGPAGRHVQALVDGVPTATLHRLGPQPLERVVRGQAPGTHTLGLRFYDPPSGRHGVTVTREMVVAPASPGHGR